MDGLAGLLAPAVAPAVCSSSGGPPADKRPPEAFATTVRLRNPGRHGVRAAASTAREPGGAYCLLQTAALAGPVTPGEQAVFAVEAEHGAEVVKLAELAESVEEGVLGVGNDKLRVEILNRHRVVLPCRGLAPA